LFEWPAIGIGEVVGIGDANGSVVARGRRGSAVERPFFVAQRLAVALRAVTPRAWRVGHEANAVHPVTVIETVDVDRAMSVGEDSADLDILERITVVWSG
jgi:hypothetical protein